MHIVLGFNANIGDKEHGKLSSTVGSYQTTRITGYIFTAILEGTRQVLSSFHMVQKSLRAVANFQRGL